jgi:hypothetical protein
LLTLSHLPVFTPFLILKSFFILIFFTKLNKNTHTLSLSQILDAVPDCDEISSHTGVGLYSSDSTECSTSLTSKAVYVATALEPYLYLGSPHSTCKDMVDTVYSGVSDPLQLARPLYIDSDDLVSRPSLKMSPLLAPYLVQVLTEVLVDLLWSLGRFTPSTRTDNCVEVDRMFMCGTAFSSGEKQVCVCVYVCIGSL